MKYLIPVLQVGGFVASVALLVAHAPHGWFVFSFGVHLAGDLLLIAAEGLPNMSFLDSFESAVKIKPWLQFVGMFLALIAFVFIGLFRHTQFFVVSGVILGVVAIGIAFAGFDYKKLYP